MFFSPLRSHLCLVACVVVCLAVSVCKHAAWCQEAPAEGANQLKEGSRFSFISQERLLEGAAGMNVVAMRGTGELLALGLHGGCCLQTPVWGRSKTPPPNSNPSEKS